MKRRLFSGIILISLLLSFSLLIHTQHWEELSKKENPTFEDIRKAVYDFWESIPGDKKPGYKQFKRWEWLAKNRLNAEGRIDPTLNWKGWQEKLARFGAKGTAPFSDWKCRGPFSVPKPINDTYAPGMGRINCMAFDPNDPDIIWIGAPAGGLWKTEDAGQSWSTNTDFLPNLGVSHILIHPENPDIMYIATGDRDSDNTNSYGVLKSTDGGQTWNPTGLSAEFGDRSRVHKILFHPNNPDTLIAATSFGVYKSRDAGQKWQKKITGNFRDLEVDTASPWTWYAARSGTGIYKSTDSGETWRLYQAGLPEQYFNRVAITVSKSSPNILYSVFVKDVDSSLYGLYRSTDYGNTWALQADSPNLLGNTLSDPSDYSQGQYDLTLDVHPTNPDIIYVGGVLLWKSTDSGRNWTPIGWNIRHPDSYTHVDHHDFAFHPDRSSTIFSCNDGGIFRSDDAGKTWTDISNGIAIHQIYKLGISRQNPNLFISGSQDNGSDFYNREWLHMRYGDGMECIIDPTNPLILYVSDYHSRIYRTEDGGRFFRLISTDIGINQNIWVNALVMDPIDPSTLYTATHSIFKSTNKGDSWTDISGSLSGDALGVLTVAPSNSFCMYTSDGNRLFRTLNGGNNWEEKDTTEMPKAITGIAVHPLNPDIIWISIGGYGMYTSTYRREYNSTPEKVLRSGNGGQTWTDITGSLPNIPATSLAVDPFSHGIYLGTDLGVFYSESGRGNWQRFDNNLPNVIVTELEIHEGAKKIVASTFGRGIWESPLAPSPAPPAIHPPLYFSGDKHVNQSLFQVEYLHTLFWKANPKNNRSNLSQYRIYIEIKGSFSLLAELSPDIYEYKSRKLDNRTYHYKLTAVDLQGRESDPVHLIMN